MYLFDYVQGIFTDVKNTQKRHRLLLANTANIKKEERMHIS